MSHPLPPDARIERFLRGLVRRGRLVVVGSAALRGAILVGLAWVVASIVVPRHASLVLLVALGAALLATLVAWLRSRVPIERADEDLGLADRLPTWVTSRPAPTRSARGSRPTSRDRWRRCRRTACARSIGSGCAASPT
jgi:hypothetical protein